MCVFVCVCVYNCNKFRVPRPAEGIQNQLWTTDIQQEFDIFDDSRIHP